MRLLRRPALVLATLALLVVAGAVTTNALPLRQIVDQQQEVDAARATLDSLTNENAVLTDQVSALQSPLEVERLAREKLGYVRPGEAAYVVIEQEAPVAGLSTPVEGEVAEAEAVPFLSRLWDFVSGQDLVDE